VSKKTTTKAGTFTRSAGDRFVGIKGAAEYLNVSERTVRNMLYDGRLKAVQRRRRPRRPRRLTDGQR
jgi:excisionase family DNA binding protein